MTGVWRGWKLSMWLLLATIFAHALLPTGSALARTAGSAFSAATADVSLAPRRKIVPAKAKHDQGCPDQAADGFHDRAMALVEDVIAVLSRRAPTIVHLHDFPRFGLPPSSIETGPFQARAPPFS